MEEEKLNIRISFLHKGKPYELAFQSSDLYRKPKKLNVDNINLQESYKENELIIRGYMQPLLSMITSRLNPLFLTKVILEYDCEVVFEAKEYDVTHIPSMNK